MGWISVAVSWGKVGALGVWWYPLQIKSQGIDEMIQGGLDQQSWWILKRWPHWEKLVFISRWENVCVWRICSMSVLWQPSSCAGNCFQATARSKGNQWGHRSGLRFTVVWCFGSEFWPYFIINILLFFSAYFCNYSFLFVLFHQLKPVLKESIFLKYLFSRRPNCFQVLGNLLHKLIVFLFF